jgi:hypothetical protein
VLNEELKKDNQRTKVEDVVSSADFSTDFSWTSACSVSLLFVRLTFS